MGAFSAGFSGAFDSPLADPNPVPPQPGMLITLAKVKQLLGITDSSHDDAIDQAGPVVSEWFEGFCNRGLVYVIDDVYESETWPVNKLYLYRFPVAAIRSATVDGVPAMAGFWLDARRGIMASGCPTGPHLCGHQQVTVVYTAGYPQDRVPADLADAYARCIGTLIGYPAGAGSGGSGSGAGNSGSGGTGAIKSINLAGAISIGFDTASTSGYGTDGGYTVDYVPPELQPYAATLRRYRVEVFA